MEAAKLVHDELVLIAEKRNGLDVRQAQLLVLADRLELWSLYNCVHIYEYLERYCDLKPRTAREHVRVARALVALPAMRTELDANRIKYSIVRELTRIAMPETEVEWLERVKKMSVREVEEELAGRQQGDRPHDPKDPEHLVELTLELRQSTIDTFMTTRARYRDEQGQPLSDDEVVLAMCRNGNLGDDGEPP